MRTSSVLPSLLSCRESSARHTAGLVFFDLVFRKRTGSRIERQRRQSGRDPGEDGRGFSSVRNHRIRGLEDCEGAPSQGLERLEYRGYDSAGLCLIEDEGLDYVRAVGNLDQLKEAAGPQRLRRRRPASATRAGRRTGGSPYENAHPLTGCVEDEVAVVLNGIVENFRELRDSPRSRRPHLHVGDRRRGRRAPRRAPLPGRPRRGGARDVRRARGPLRLRRHPPRPSRHARRRAAPVPARRRRRRRGDVPRLLDRRVPARDAPRPADRGRRGRRHHARRRSLLPRRRRARPRPGRDGGRLGRRGGREAGLRDLHAQGDLRAAAGDRRHDRRAASRGNRLELEDLGLTDLEIQNLRRMVILACGTAYHAGVVGPLRDRGVGADPLRARHRERVDLPQPGAPEGHARRRHLPVGRDRDTVAGRAPRPRERRATPSRSRT